MTRWLVGSKHLPGPSDGLKLIPETHVKCPVSWHSPTALGRLGVIVCTCTCMCVGMRLFLWVWVRVFPEDSHACCSPGSVSGFRERVSHWSKLVK